MKIKKCDCRQGEACKCGLGIYKIYCQGCGRFLLEGPLNSATYCPTCRRWTRLEPDQVKGEGVKCN